MPPENTKRENCLDEVGGRRGGPSFKTDQDLAQAIHAPTNDPLGQKLGVHTRASIEKLEAKKLPWRRGRR